MRERSELQVRKTQGVVCQQHAAPRITSRENAEPERAVPVVLIAGSIDVSWQVGQERTQLVFDLAATELVVRVLQAIGYHQVCGAGKLTLCS